MLDPSLPADVLDCIKTLVTQYETILEANLFGIYVHGSIAMGCFNPDSSDIDVLVTVKNALSLETKKQLGRVHVALSYNFNRKIELSVVTQDVLDCFVYPTPFEFHYGEDIKDSFVEGTVDLITKRTDPDLAAHFVITKHSGITLRGDLAQSVFPEVPPEDYLDSIARDAEWCFNNIMTRTENGVCAVPTYAVLNFCRVLAFIEDGLITSKRSGGEWALDFVPRQYHPVIQEALNEYAKTGSSKEVSSRVLKDFAEFSYEIIKKRWQ